jgi:hypothetical protein
MSCTGHVQFEITKNLRQRFREGVELVSAYSSDSRPSTRARIFKSIIAADLQKLAMICEALCRLATIGKISNGKVKLSSSISSKLTSRCVHIRARTDKETRMCADEFWCKHMIHALTYTHVMFTSACVRKEGITGAPYAGLFAQTCGPLTISDKLMPVILRCNV